MVTTSCSGTDAASTRMGTVTSGRALAATSVETRAGTRRDGRRPGSRRPPRMPAPSAPGCGCPAPAGANGTAYGPGPAHPEHSSFPCRLRDTTRETRPPGVRAGGVNSESIRRAYANFAITCSDTYPARAPAYDEARGCPAAARSARTTSPSGVVRRYSGWILQFRGTSAPIRYNRGAERPRQRWFRSR